VIFVDTNIIMDVLENEPTPHGEWSRRVFAREAGRHALVANLIVAAELSGQVQDTAGLNDMLAAAEITLMDLDLAVAYRAGSAFRRYRQRGGARTAILPDFIIAAHAEALGAILMTRDRGLGSYFPDLTLLTPETDHG
jgi:predicted nucleic acid-binding protein